MNSIKNLMVVVLLMGVSYGAFQVINTPDPTLNPSASGQPLEIPSGAPQADILEKPFPGLMSNETERGTGIADNPSPFASSGALPEKEVEPASKPSLPSLPPGIDPSTAATDDPPSLNGAPAIPPQWKGDNTPSNNALSSGNRLGGGGSFSATPGGPLDPPAADPAENTDANNLVTNSNFPGGGAPPLLASSPGLEPVTPRPDTATNPASNPVSSAPITIPATSPFSPPANPVTESTTSTAAPAPVAPSGAITQLPPDNPMAMSAPANSTPPAPPATLATIDWNSIAAKANAGKVRDALTELSAFYDKPLAADQRMQMLEWLDLLAGKVIYSTEHHLETRPYIVAAGETLESIAGRWNVPPQLVYNVNRSKIGDSPVLTPGTELKIIPGPFNARISIDRMEMTLFLGDMYAGRFPVEMGKDAALQQGSFIVEGRSDNGREYVAATGQSIPAGSPGNPYGRFWIGLGNGNPCIHEAATMGSGTDSSGCIRMASRDAQDVYGILSEGSSQISILR